MLDPGSVGAWAGATTFAAWMHWDDAAAKPRRYVHRTEAELVLYDGTAVDPTGRVAAHDAASLAEHWEALPELLEGRFAIVRIATSDESLELINDPFGMHPLFELRQGASWWVSNSARLLARLARAPALDLDAVADFVSHSTPGRDRTLVSGVTALPAAQHWRQVGNAPLQRATYLRAAEFARLPRRSFGAREAAELAADMGAALRALGAVFGPLECPITAGRDSRMMTGLMMGHGIPGTYFTAGEEGSPDARLGTAIARRFDLPHRRAVVASEDLVTAWDELSRRVVQANDGMVTLAHIANAAGCPPQLERASVHLYGAGGELARLDAVTPRFALGQPTLRQAIVETQRSQEMSRGTLLSDARRSVLDDIERACRTLHEQGFAPFDIPSAFDFAHANRRWAGSQARQIVDHVDVFMPFITRPYVRAAFSIPPVERLMERVPYLLLEHLSPELRAMPGQQRWMPQSLPMLLAHFVGSRVRAKALRVRHRLMRTRKLQPGILRDRLTLIESQLPRWRERYLDRRASSLWQVIDRERFEHLTSDRTTQRERLAHTEVMFRIATVFAFEEDLTNLVGEARQLDATRSARDPRRPVGDPGLMGGVPASAD